jgi:hypothetical protein
LDSEAVEAAVKKTWADLFERGSYANGANGAGVAVIRSQVLAFVQQMDFTEQIKAIAAAQIHGALADVIQEVLRTEGKKQAKALVKSGMLLGTDE